MGNTIVYMIKLTELEQKKELKSVIKRNKDVKI